MIRRFVALSLLGACLVPVVLAGCAKKKLLAVGNLPPETTLFVQGPLDTVNHVVHLYWFGSDPDGEVVGFELRFHNPAQPADTQWAFTTRTDSLFTVLTPSGYSMPIFEVRAIDDLGQRDPSPDSADFQFSNQAPTVRFTQRLLKTDTTYASVTLAWTAGDPDGDARALRFQVGLDTLGLQAPLHWVSGNGVTLDTDDFKEGGVYPATQPRMAFIRAIDDGGRVSVWDSVRWVVRSPSTPGVHPQLLLIDDEPGVVLSAHDRLYRGAAGSLPAGSYSLLQLGLTQPFRSVKDLLQTFRQFDAVVWYRGLQSQVGGSSVMRDYQDGMATYLDGGGKLMIESLNLIEGENAAGALSGDWVTRYFGSSGLIRSQNTIAGLVDSTVDWSLAPSYTDTIPDPDVTYPVNLASTVFDDTLGNNINIGGLRGFAVLDTGFVALWARDSTLSPRVPRDVPVAVTVPVAGAGRVIVFTLPLAGANRFLNAPRFLCKVFRQMGLGPGTCP